jgi:uncharacterized protein YdhG (YjbR/CyaY superfamily)
MKKPKSAAQQASVLGRASPGDFEEYLAAAPKDSRGALKKLRAAILSAVPIGTTETISYRMPAFSRGGVLVWYAAFSSHCSLFPKAKVIRNFKDDLKGYTTSTGTVQFPNDKPLPLGLIKRLVKAAVGETAQ